MRDEGLRVQLQAQAFRQIACAHAGGLHGLQQAQGHGQQMQQFVALLHRIGVVIAQLQQQAVGQLFQRIGQPAALVERVDQALQGRLLLRIQPQGACLLFQMPGEAGGGLQAVLPVAIIVAGRGGRVAAVRLPGIVGVSGIGGLGFASIAAGILPVLPECALAVLLRAGTAGRGVVGQHGGGVCQRVRAFFANLLRWPGFGAADGVGQCRLPGRQCLQALFGTVAGYRLLPGQLLCLCGCRIRTVSLGIAAVFGFLGQFQKGVFGKGLLQLLLQFLRGQLQQPDRLLELRRERQSLRRAQLQAGLHGAYMRKCSPR